MTFVVALVWAGWWLYDQRYPSWTEEVKLSDGRVITIHQKHEYRENYGTSQSWVTIDLPELGGERVWHSMLMPQRIDVHAGLVYVFGLPRGPAQLAHYRYPKSFMVAFKWNGNGFERIPFLAVPAELRQSENVYRCVPATRKNLIRVDAKRNVPCPPRGDRGELTHVLDLDAYSRAADAMAALANWKNRSE